MIEFNTPFCDYLTVTYSGDTGTPEEALSDFLPSVGLLRSYVAPGYEYWCSVSFSRGKLITRKNLLVKKHGSGLLVTVYGAGLEYFREHDNPSAMGDLLCILGTYRHNLTRLDIAMDLPVDTPDFFLDFLPRVSTGLFALRRDMLKVTRVISVRDDGLETGTVYIGKGSNARVKCTVYDKQHERLVIAGENIKPRTRIEFRIAKDFGASLFDALSPASLFWELACPKILNNKPADIPVWTKRQGFTRLPEVRKQREINHFDVLKNLIYENPLFSTLISYSDKHIGEDGRRYLINTITRLINNPAMGLEVKD